MKSHTKVIQNKSQLFDIIPICSMNLRQRETNNWIIKKNHEMKQKK